MALTKVKLPVAAISAIVNGTSDITIGTASGNLVVTRGGTVVGTWSTAGLTLATAGTLDADIISGEAINLATTSGAAATIETTLTQLEIGTSSAHPLELSANDTTALTIATDGKVALAVDGTAANHLVDKGYVDTAVAAAASIADIAAVTGTTGSISIPNSTGNNLIINWGTTASINSGSGAVAVTFNREFPNAFLQAVVSRVIASNGAEEGVNYASGSTTGMNIYATYSASSPCSYVAIGY